MNKLIQKIFSYIRQKIFNFLYKIQLKRRNHFLNKQRELLKNKDFTLIANNCNGGVLSHELGLRFNSPLVNLFINTEDYVKYLKNFDYYNSLTLSFVTDDTKSYPIGKLDDVTIDFVHYKSNEEAEQKWEERKKRINKNNMFIIFTEQNDCTEQCLKEFDNLPFENKVVFTYKKHDSIKSAVFVKKYENSHDGVTMFLDFEDRFSIKRNYDCFDFITWFNGEKNLNILMRE